MSITRWPAAFSICLAASGCAGILGLDTGRDLDADVDAATNFADAGTSRDDDGGSTSDGATSDAGSSADASKVDSSTPPTCGPATADCNGNPSDGCEANLNDPAHCGSCRNVCPPVAVCMAPVCCMPEHATCAINSDCCSNNCGPGGSGCKK